MNALTDLADWMENQLGDELASRQAIADQALIRLREISALERATVRLRDVSAATIDQALRDAIAHQREHRAADDWPGQVSIYQRAGRELGLDLGDERPAGPVLDPSGRQLDDADVAALRDALTEALTAVSGRLAAPCDACAQSPASVCGEHVGETTRAAAFRDLAERLSLPDHMDDQVTPPGVALSPGDLLEVHGALTHAAAFLTERAGQPCLDCTDAPSGACESHMEDLDQAAVYRAVADRLGGAR